MFPRCRICQKELQFPFMPKIPDLRGRFSTLELRMFTTKNPTESLLPCKQLTAKGKQCQPSCSRSVSATSGVYARKPSALLQTCRFWNTSHAFMLWAHLFEQRLKVKRTVMLARAKFSLRCCNPGQSYRHLCSGTLNLSAGAQWKPGPHYPL